MNEKIITQRLEQLESQLAFQDHTINELNQLIAEQNQELARFKRHLQLLAQRVEHARDQSDDEPADQLPPHY